MTGRKHATRLIAILLVSCLALSAQAARKKSRATKNNNTQNSNLNQSNLPPVKVPEVDTTASTDAKSKLSLAQGRLERAQDSLNSQINQLKKEFESSSELAAAMSELKQAQLAANDAATPVTAKLAARSDYQTALASKKTAQAKIDALHSESGASQVDLNIAANEVMEKAGAVSRIQQDALDADPAYHQAKDRVTLASAKIGQLRVDFENSLKNNAQCQKLREEIAQARQDVSAASSVYSSALAKQRSQESARQAALDEQARRDRTNPQYGNNASNSRKKKNKNA